MTTSDHYQIVPDEIRGHASNVAVVADELAAVATRMPSRLGDDALGSFAAFVTSGLQSAMAEVASATQHAASSVDEMSAGLTRTAENYHSIEIHNATSLSQEYPG
ncbi:type VII secretion target [Kibdelosporangium phytohabitans]|uniref:ESX-1 secretion-associated protein n=1 Tax=Kibdelosporangium phytohabitans TaxID=860235 RepID=A0A0N9HYB8_9PSEU|nr:type VII secretion target [Kibdelosporangium phytohabitans]ALG08635.1 hypothetical protein AOZ06_18455 [Kibdelosporangium phytohabitans]MBE1470272.1 hypothetical protein [Kibdelosporangium phytohabitans]